MALNHPSPRRLAPLLERPVCAVAGIAPVNSLGWVSAELAAHYENTWGGTFAPGTFPKDLADALAG